ncbi:MAG TPA: glycosyltransferase, partial [Puia sp.]|nr:glycosyltransferase [Puia sp.]
TFGNMSWRSLRNDRQLTTIPPSIGINTGSWLLRQKKRIYRDSDLTIVTPSVWLKELAVQSPVFDHIPVHQIYNGVDTSVYRPLDKKAVKRKLGIPEDQPTIIFSSHYLTVDNPWKGGRDLVEILRKLDQLTGRTISFLALGDGRMDELDELANLHIRYTGYIRNEPDMVDCLNAADLLIYPTRADNLPNVLVESIACGTPAVTFDIGGNTEIIEHDYNGVVIPPFDLDAFAHSTLSLLEDPERRMAFSANGLVKVQQRFEERTMVDRYYLLFEQIKENHR